MSPLKVYPSKLDLAVHCAAAPQRNLAFPFVETEASIRGSHLHEVTSLVIQAGMDEFDDLCGEMGEDDKAAVKTCVEVARMLMPKGKHIRFIEEKMDLKFLGSTSGKPDLAYYDEASQTVCVVDWKFGKGQVPDPTENWQLKAYAIVISNELVKQGKATSNVYLVICQPCGTVKQSYRDATFKAEEMKGWEGEIKQAIEKAQVKDVPATPGPHCRRCFCEAGKNGACPEFKAYSADKAEEKADLVARKDSFAVGGITPVVVESADLSFPIIVISQEAIEKAEDFRSRAEGLVLDKNSADGMGLLLNEITTFEGQMTRNLKEVKKPLRELEDRIDAACSHGLLPLREAKVKAKSELDKWVAEQKAIQAAEQAEFERKKREAEEAERKAREEGLAAARRAQEATNAEEKKKALEEAKQAALRRLKAEQDAQAVSVPAVVEPVRIAGVKTKLVPEFEVTDFKGMPDTFKLVNEALLKKAIESKAVTEKDVWISIKWVEKSQSSGRR